MSKIITPHPTLCAYCRRPYGNYTKDHVIPESWYPTCTPLNTEKWQVPCCRACNNGYSSDEETIRNQLAMTIDPNDPRAQGIWPRVFRSYSAFSGKNAKDAQIRERRRQKLLDELMPFSHEHSRALVHFSRRGAENETVVTFSAKKFERVVTKLVLGAHCYLEKTPLPEAANIEVHVLQTRDAAVEAFEPLLRSMEQYELGPGILIRRGCAADVDRFASMFMFVLWGQVDLYASVEVNLHVADDSCVTALRNRFGPSAH